MIWSGPMKLFASKLEDGLDFLALSQIFEFTVSVRFDSIPNRTFNLQLRLIEKKIIEKRKKEKKKKKKVRQKKGKKGRKN